MMRPGLQNTNYISLIEFSIINIQQPTDLNDDRHSLYCPWKIRAILIYLVKLFASIFFHFFIVFVLLFSLYHFGE